MIPVVLDAGALSLRPFADPDSADPTELRRDVDDLRAAYADPAMARFVSWKVRDEREARGYLRGRATEWRGGTRCSWAVRDVDGTLLGEVGVKQIDTATGTAAMAVWTGAPARGRGVARTAVRAAADFAFDTLGLIRLTYTHAESNPASGVVARRAGFTCVGRERPDAGPEDPRADRILWVRTPTASIPGPASLPG